MLTMLVLVTMALLGSLVPVELELAAERAHDAARARVDARVRWLFGLVRVRAGTRAQQPPKRQAARERGARRRVRWTPRRLLRREVIERAFVLVARTARRLRVHRCAIHGRLGFDDPALTGMIWGGAFPLKAWLEARHAAVIDVEPEFAGSALSGTLELALAVRPLYLAYELGLFLWSRAIWRALWASRRGTP